MAERRIGIIMNGVTGRMGMNQHLIRSIAAIRADGGVLLANGDRVMPDPILVGRNEAKLAALARKYAGKLQVVTVAVSVNQPLALVRKHLATHPLAGVVLYDRQGFASEAYEAPATSYIVIVNAKGVVVYTGSGGDQKLAAAVRKAL